MKRIAILGATGSIGASTLNVIRHNPEQFCAHIVTGGKNVERMVDIVTQFRPAVAVMADHDAANLLQQRLTSLQIKCDIESGAAAICAAAEDCQIDIVVAAIVGAAGLPSTMAAIKQAKRVLLANKEALVMSGSLFMNAVNEFGAELLPIDSEHNAIYQAMPVAIQQSLGHCDLPAQGVERILLTGSGGPFRTTALEQFAAVTPKQACHHPNWSMGQKISVDSATMMNKGLEYIEAKYLFNAQKGDIQVIVHPQSVIHSMVQYIDGSVIAQMGLPDMATPIAYALSYPQRVSSGVAALDFLTLGSLEFEAPDFARYPCLKLAIDACYHSQSATTALNAANEVAVDAFLTRQIAYTQIPVVVESVLNVISLSERDSLDGILELDAEARLLAKNVVGAKHA